MAYISLNSIYAWVQQTGVATALVLNSTQICSRAQCGSIPPAAAGPSSTEAMPPVTLLHVLEPALFYLNTLSNAVLNTRTDICVSAPTGVLNGPLDFNYCGKDKSFQFNFLLHALL